MTTPNTNDVVARAVTAPVNLVQSVVKQVVSIITKEPLVVAGGTYAAVAAVRGGSLRDYVVAGVIALLREVVSPAWNAATKSE